MKNTISNFAYRLNVGQPFEEAVDSVIMALKEQGFGVLTQVDVKSTLKNKLDIDFRKYTILGVCNPSLAYNALREQLNVGLLLPCNVIVYENDDASVIEVLDPITMMDITDNPGLTPIAQEAQIRLKRVLEIVESVDSSSRN